MNAQPWLAGPLGLAGADLLAMAGHFALLSLLAVGGAVAVAPDMHRWVVGERGWLADGDFTASIALAQAAPGPNVLFVAVIGFKVGGLLGVAAAMAGCLLPSTLLVLAASRSGARFADALAVRAFKAGMAPLAVALVAATGWIVAEPVTTRPGGWAVVAFAFAWLAFTRRGPLLPIAVGAAAGALGWV